MGPKKNSGLASALFSRVQLRVLSVIFGRPEHTFHLTEIISLANSGRGAVQRELIKLVRAGIVQILVTGRRKTYRANQDSPIFEELHGIILKTAGLLDPLRKALMRYRSKIDVAFIYGSIAKATDSAKSDIDLMIIGRELPYAWSKA